VFRVPRLFALAAIAALVASASLVSFAESYRGLYLWAHHHGLAGLWTALWPVQVDAFIAVGELALFVALVDQWRARQRAAAWLVTAAGLAVSVVGNIGHVAGHSLTVRATAAVPPLAAASALAVGLGVLKRVVVRHQADAAVTAAEVDEDQAQDIGLNPVLPPVPIDAQDAALMALRGTLAAGNPLSGRQIETRFGLSRAEVAKVRQIALAETNGHDREGDSE